MSLGARGPWKRLQAIGKGSFGTVYLVQHQSAPDRKYVMKEVQLRGLPRAEMLSAQNEVSVLKKLKHPHIIAIEEALVVDDTLCIVMEWAQGKDLGALVAQRKQEKRPFTEEEVLKIFWQLTSALAYCHHELHMLHRDLKPQNVFLAANGDVKLGDFGLAKVIEATCALAKTQCGTPLYMSPELCEGKEYNRGADVYALGCILYELMTLTMPWADVRVQGPGGMSALLKKIATSSLDLTQCKKRYSAELCGLLEALLQKHGESRPALDQVLNLPMVQRAAPKAAERPLPPSWRKVPSASRPGCFSYLHVPTGYKQAQFPESDELPEEVQAALKKQTFAPGQMKPPPPTAMKPPPPPSAHAHAPSPRAAQPGPTPPPPAPPRSAAPAQPNAGPPRMATPQKDYAERPLPPSWRKVPSASRPGCFSYLHVPTGYKQSEVPTTDAPPPAMLAAWKAQAKGTVAGGQAASPAQLRGNFGRLEPVAEQPRNVLTPHGQANGAAHGRQQVTPMKANPFDFKPPTPKQAAQNNARSAVPDHVLQFQQRQAQQQQQQAQRRR